jgi:hypothetical protein
MSETTEVIHVCPTCNKATVHLQPVPDNAAGFLMDFGSVVINGILTIITAGIWLLVLLSAWPRGKSRQQPKQARADCTVCGHRSII